MYEYEWACIVLLEKNIQIDYHNDLSETLTLVSVTIGYAYEFSFPFILSS